MPINSTLDVLIQQDDLVVLGPPETIDVSVDIGPEGERGSQIFVGIQDPNTLTLNNFLDLYNLAPKFRDLFIRNGTGENNGVIYQYLSSTGTQWEEVVNIYDLTISNNVTSLTGTSGQISVSASTGAITISLANTSVTASSYGSASSVGTFTVDAMGRLTSASSVVISIPQSSVTNLTSDLALKAALASPALTGTPTAPTAPVDTNTTQIATTAYVIGQGYTKLASPAFTGTPTAPTAAADTNTTQIATTAYVVGQAGSASPVMDGTATVGTSLRYARQDHVHPTDTSRAPLASPALTGTPTSTTAAADTNTTQIATTAYVVGQAGSASPVMDGTATVGTSLRYARQDHVHPTDTSRAPTASPTFTGTVTVPTPTSASAAANKVYVDTMTRNTQTASAYTVASSDAGKLIEMNNASANTLTIPPYTTASFEDGTVIDIVQIGAGQTSIAAGSGVTINSSGGKLKLTGQYSAATLIKRGSSTTDIWLLIGDITT